MQFYNKIIEALNTNKSSVCVGLDSDIRKIPESLRNDTNPLWKFNKEIIDATKEVVIAYKPNYAFYLSAGSKGLEALEKTLDYIPSNIPVILDVKCGDIGNTMEHYADGYFDVMKVDAITINPLMGSDVYKAVFKKQGRFVFALALTSNPSAQDYLLTNELYKTLAIDIHSYGKYQAGAVVGATQSDQLKQMRELMPESLFLVPGIGAQGGSVKDVVDNAKINKEIPGFIINSSRGIIFADSSTDFAESAYKSAEALRKEINAYL
ncbi:MAG: orotidine-5'-phosphate decarboxylase [Candidatus Cloacimonadales bacterium]|jgi:orotidine-5'-phosphate decarboxylase|nr:orotidine-5'-phosphate decarboxylase [Candidatus Cloacimonadota bacterium]MDD2651261.1 orotidine-5'-phosphate decarboxylase [Candidatus Cloacimonadota bacterium]MDD3500985.1 orotidine-5'-phosphate decarboxylase [Candidatus Cloacimonadota bacterium]MDX9977161.1 orotidine-5'-phosphate decarboxylase [Candidatus Cloacimonadales bacterium]